MSGIVFACFLLGGVTNECELNSYCPAGKTNIGCNPAAVPGASTCSLAVVVEMTEARKDMILDAHNSRRATLAQGELAGFSPAARMATMQWDDELAAQAGHNARTCIFQHDECRNTNEFRWAGQNLALMTYTLGGSFPYEAFLNSFIKMWWDENMDATQEQINSYPNNYSGPDIGHFTQMASERAARIGCAMQDYVENSSSVVYFVCNYSYTNIIGRPVYTVGTTALGCTTGENPTYPGLCSTNEVIPTAP